MPEEVVLVLKRTSLHFISGSNPIRSLIIAVAQNAILGKLCEIYNALRQHGINRTSCENAKYVLIPKPCKKGNLKAKSYRPNSIQSCPSKKLEKIVAQRMALYRSEIGVIFEIQ